MCLLFLGTRLPAHDGKCIFFDPLDDLIPDMAAPAAIDNVQPSTTAIENVVYHVRRFLHDL
jgi:hypothetical protein